jgi:hypothetical protein
MEAQELGGMVCDDGIHDGATDAREPRTATLTAQSVTNAGAPVLRTSPLDRIAEAHFGRCGPSVRERRLKLDRAATRTKEILRDPGQTRRARVLSPHDHRCGAIGIRFAHRFRVSQLPWKSSEIIEYLPKLIRRSSIAIDARQIDELSPGERETTTAGVHVIDDCANNAIVENPVAELADRIGSGTQCVAALRSRDARGCSGRLRSVLIERQAHDGRV